MIESSSAQGRPSEEALFPVFMKLSGRLVVLVGAGTVARSKLTSVLACGARVRVVSPRRSFVLDDPRVTFVEKAFEPSDLDGAWLVIAAAPPHVNREVARAAEDRRVPLNAVDDPSAASVYLGGVVRRAGFVFALCSQGSAPALTALLREALAALLPDELEQWVSRAVELRAKWRRDGVPMEARRPLLLDALNAMYAERQAAVHRDEVRP